MKKILTKCKLVYIAVGTVYRTLRWKVKTRDLQCAVNCRIKCKPQIQFNELVSMQFMLVFWKVCVPSNAAVWCFLDLWLEFVRHALWIILYVTNKFFKSSVNIFLSPLGLCTVKKKLNVIKMASPEVKNYSSQNTFTGTWNTSCQQEGFDYSCIKCTVRKLSCF